MASNARSKEVILGVCNESHLVRNMAQRKTHQRKVIKGGKTKEGVNVGLVKLG